MTIQRDLWHRVVPREKFPGLPCPRCPTGKLKIVEKSLSVKEPIYSAKWREENFDDWEPWYNTQRWSAELVCDESVCGEIVHAMGDTDMVDASVPAPNGEFYPGLEEVLHIQALFPAPHFFKLSGNIPGPVSKELEVAFRMYWADTAACVARLRTSVERLLDDQKVPTEKKTKKGSMARMNLRERIDAFASGAHHASQLQGLRNIGNLGTHGGDSVTDEDLFDAIDVLEFVLTGIYDANTINAKASKLLKKK